LLGAVLTISPDVVTVMPIPVFCGSRKLRIYDRDRKTSENAGTSVAIMCSIFTARQ